MSTATLHKVTEAEGYIVLAEGDAPTSADLAENIEVKFTNSITAKAAELGNGEIIIPKIYQTVINAIERTGGTIFKYDPKTGLFDPPPYNQL